MRFHIIHTVAFMASLKWASADIIYRAVTVSPPFSSVSPEAAESSMASPHIFGGTEAAPHSHPHQVALNINIMDGNGTTKIRDVFCGGSLISDSWIITAAHCVENKVVRLADLINPRTHKYK